MEEEGWFYLFQHAADGHTLIIADSNAACARLRDGTVTLRPGDGPDSLAAWQPGQATAHGPVQPSTPISGETDTALTAPGAPNRAPFRWPARTARSDLAQQRSRAAIEAAEAEAVLAHGRGFNADFYAGACIQVIAPLGASPEAYIIRSVSHEAVSDSWTNAAGPAPAAASGCASCRAGAAPPWAGVSRA